jgi:hypothetical protein
VQEDAPGQFALQADERLLRVFDRGVRQQDDEFLATKAGQRILRAHRFADDGDEVDQRGVAGVVAERVVELLEVVDVEQRDAQRRLAALARATSFSNVSSRPAAVERAGQLVVANQRAGAVEFVSAAR